MSSTIDSISYLIEKLKPYGYKIETYLLNGRFTIKITHHNANATWYINYHIYEYDHADLYDGGFFGPLSYQDGKFHNPAYGYKDRFNNKTCARYTKTLIHLAKMFNRRGQHDI